MQERDILDVEKRINERLKTLMSDQQWFTREEVIKIASLYKAKGKFEEMQIVLERLNQVDGKEQIERTAQKRIDFLNSRREQ